MTLFEVYRSRPQTGATWRAFERLFRVIPVGQLVACDPLLDSGASKISEARRANFVVDYRRLFRRHLVWCPRDNLLKFRSP